MSIVGGPGGKKVLAIVTFSFMSKSWLRLVVLKIMQNRELKALKLPQVESSTVVQSSQLAK